MINKLEEAQKLLRAAYPSDKRVACQILCQCLTTQAVIEALALSTTNEERAQEIRALSKKYGLNGGDMLRPMGLVPPADA